MIIQGKTYQNPLFVFAMEVEAGNEFEEVNKVFTGVGKVNATYQLMKGIQQYQPDVIINLGTAGSTSHNRGSVVCCTQFIQRDMDVIGLGFQKFQTPFENTPVILENGLELSHLPIGICGSGDQFEMEHINDEYNVVEMEAYALAKVAMMENLPFLSLKYISDGADGNADDDWSLQVKKAAVALKQAVYGL